MISVPEHLRSVYSRLLDLPPSQPPAPWVRVTSPGIGGLAEVGFLESSDLLLVISSNGRGLFDCESGERLARDQPPDFEYDQNNLLARGIGPVEDKWIRTAGLSGGGLAAATADGWRLKSLTLVWPHDFVFLSPPGHWVLGPAFGKPGDVTKFQIQSTLRAFGFSPTGKSMIIATRAFHVLTEA